MNWTKQILKTDKPIIAMCHIRALPGDPGYDKAAGMKWVIEKPVKIYMPCKQVEWIQSCSPMSFRCPT